MDNSELNHHIQTKVTDILDNSAIYVREAMMSAVPTGFAAFMDDEDPNAEERSIADQIKSGDAIVTLQCLCDVTELTFSDKMLRPEVVAEKAAFDQIVPTKREQVEDELRRELAEELGLPLEDDD
jgi:hypothetical protein